MTAAGERRQSVAAAGPSARRPLLAVWARIGALPRPSDASCFVGHLRSGQRASALRAVVDGLVVTVTLRRHGARPLLGAPQRPTARVDAHRSMEVSAAVDAGLGLLPVMPTCLRRSLTLMRELDRLDLAATLHIGVRSVMGNVEAHAWVEVGDVVVNDDPTVRQTYVELASGDLERVLPLLA